MAFDFSNGKGYPRSAEDDPPYQPMPIFLFYTSDGSLNPHYLIKTDQRTVINASCFITEHFLVSWMAS